MEQKKLNKIIKSLQKGDNQSFKILYSEYSSLFKGIAYRYSNNNDESNDIIQEAFIKIFQNIKSYQYKGSFEGWMKRILINSCLDHIRKNKLDEIELHNDVSYYDEDVISEMAFDEIVTIINTLPIGYKTVFNLAVFDGYSHKEIGELLNISESASRSQLTKAKASLRKKMVNSKMVKYA